MDIVSNNLASVNTTGYKRDHVVSHEFSDKFLHRINDPGIRMFRSQVMGQVNPGVFVDDVFTVFDQGAMQRTENSLDLAIMGRGFFVVERDGEEFYTRDGSFSLSPGGFLVTSTGERVQGLDGDIIISGGEILIKDSGEILVEGQSIGSLRLVSFADLHTLRKMEDNLFHTTPESVTIPFTGTVEQGFLEGSNVNIVNEMVNMITLSRHYDATARILTVTDNTLQAAVNEIARR
jgi:flagellar basal-body rod protein FlgG